MSAQLPVRGGLKADATGAEGREAPTSALDAAAAPAAVEESGRTTRCGCSTARDGRPRCGRHSRRTGRRGATATASWDSRSCRHTPTAVCVRCAIRSRPDPVTRTGRRRTGGVAVEHRDRQEERATVELTAAGSGVARPASNQEMSRRRPRPAASRWTRSLLRSAHRPESRSSLRLRTARCSASGPTLVHTDDARRT